VLVEVTEGYDIVECHFSRRINIAEVKHETVSIFECQLQHSSHPVDLMLHVFQEHGEVFDKADLVLIERQPPTGLVHIESLVYMRYRSKALLVSPNSVHKHFGMSADYEERKRQVDEMAGPYIANDYTRGLWRTHDMSDAFVFVLYHCQVQQALRRKYNPSREPTEQSVIPTPFARFVCGR
jgi:hypothetical protein